jgi:plastocyanin
MTIRSKFNFTAVVAAAALGVLVAACGEQQQPPATSTQSTPGGKATLCATCKVATVQMTTSEAGNFFTPSTIEMGEGDVLRFTLVTGVHNVNFLPDSNPGKSSLPPASDMLQLPGQTKDIELRFGKGTFYFQCDPHAALGMVGTVTVK